MDEDPMAEPARDKPAPDSRPGGVTSDDGPVSSATEGVGRTRTLVVLAVISVTVLLADLLTKTLAVHLLTPGEPVSIIGDVVTFTLVRNSGAAFSMASGYTWVLTLIALVVVAGIIRYSGRLRSGWWILGLGLALGGAIGNLADRIFREPGPLRGHVVDFVSVGWWPVFNVADSAVVCGAVLLVGLSLYGIEYDGTRTGWAARRGEDRVEVARAGHDDRDAPGEQAENKGNADA